MGRRGLVAVAFALGCAAGVGDPAGGFGFGGAPVGGQPDEDESEDSTGTDDDDDDDGNTSGVSGLDTGDDTSASGVPPPDDTSGPPPGTSGPPPGTSGPPDASDSSGLPEVGSTTSPFGDTGIDTGGSGGLGSPCEQNTDCNSNICVNAGFALYCSEQCMSAQDCPPGWLCVETTTPGLSVCF
jgi:hypothetical protein